MQEQSDAVGILAGKVTTYGGGGSAFIFGMSSDTFAALCGIAIAIVGVCIQWYFNARRDKRHATEHAAKMALYRRGVDPGDGE
jgi:hypothetical protein